MALATISITCPSCSTPVAPGTFTVTKLPNRVRRGRLGKKYNPLMAYCTCGKPLGVAGFIPLSQEQQHRANANSPSGQEIVTPPDIPGGGDDGGEVTPPPGGSE